jgi:hypothetical protein
MPANTAPIYTLPPSGVGCAITAALTKSNGDGTIGTDIFKAYTAGSNGAWLSKVRISLGATTAATATQATVARVYLSSATSGATTGGTNTFFIAEIAVPSQSADNTASATYPLDIPIGMAVPAGWTVLVSTHHAPAANSSVQAIVSAGDY